MDKGKFLLFGKDLYKRHKKIKSIISSIEKSQEYLDGEDDATREATFYRGVLEGIEMAMSEFSKKL